MEPTKPKTSAKDFFMQLATMVALYWTTGALMNLLYTVINVKFPQVDAYYYGTNSISFPVASLVVIFPLFLALSWFTQKGYAESPEKRELGVRKWLTYLTLFAAGLTLVGSLVYVIYLFLDGQELTTGFLLKVLSWLVVAGIIFGYYLQDIRNKIMGSQRKVWAGAGALIILISVVLGFAVIGSPRTQRLVRYDSQKIADLQSIQSQVIDYWQTKSKLPATLDDMKDSLSYLNIPKDTQTGTSYEYTVKGPQAFELCATFNLKSTDSNGKPRISNAMYYVGMENENWKYDAGHTCFSRTVDLQRYPPFNKNL